MIETMNRRYNSLSKRKPENLSAEEAAELASMNLAHNLALQWEWEEQVWEARYTPEQLKELARQEKDAKDRGDWTEYMRLQDLPRGRQHTVKHTESFEFDEEDEDLLKLCKWSLDADERLQNRSRKHGQRVFARMMAEKRLGRPLEDHEHVVRKEHMSCCTIWRWEEFEVVDTRARRAEVERRNAVVRHKWLELPGKWNGLMRWDDQWVYCWKPTVKHQLQNPDTGRRYSYSVDWDYANFEVSGPEAIDAIKSVLDPAHRELTALWQQFRWGKYIPENPEGYKNLNNVMQIEIKARQKAFEELAKMEAEKAKPIEVPVEIEEMLESNERWLKDHPSSYQAKRFLFNTDEDAWRKQQNEALKGQFRSA